MDRFAARRKILRGSLSAPLVLTVASPAALARQSFEACLYRASQQSPTDAPAFIEVTAHDTWLRKRVPVYEGKLKAASKKELFYKNADGAFYKVNADACSSGPYAATKDVFPQHGYNIYVNALSGTGPTPTVRRLLEEFEHGSAELTDKCFVHNLHDEDAPRLIGLSAGKGAGFQKDMGNLVAELRKGIPAVFDSRRYQEERKNLLEHFQERQRSVLRDFERRVKERGFDVVQIQAGPGVRPEIAPVLDGNPVTFEQLQAKVDSGEVTPEQSKRIQQEQSQLEAQMDLVMREMRNIERKAKAQLEQLNTRVVVPLVEELLDDLGPGTRDPSWSSTWWMCRRKSWTTSDASTRRRSSRRRGSWAWLSRGRRTNSGNTR